MGMDARDARLGLSASLRGLSCSRGIAADEQLGLARAMFWARTPACEQAVMANAVKAGWQDMNEEAADELVGREPHDFLSRSAFDAIILVFECDAVAVASKQAAVGDGDAVGVAATDRPTRPRDRRRSFAINHPFDLA